MDAPSADLQAGTVALEAAKVTSEELLELVPSVYESVSFLDVRFMLEDPVLKEALEEEQPWRFWALLRDPFSSRRMPFGRPWEARG